MEAFVMPSPSATGADATKGGGDDLVVFRAKGSASEGEIESADEWLRRESGNTWSVLRDGFFGDVEEHFLIEVSIDPTSSAACSPAMKAVAQSGAVVILSRGDGGGVHDLELGSDEALLS